MVTPQAPPDGDRDRGPQMLALFWTTYPMMIAMVGLRTAVRWRMRSLGKDDLMMLIAVVVQTAGSIPFTLYLTKGGLRHVYYIDPPELPELIKLNFISQPFGAFAAVFAKMSVAFLVLRITTHDHYWRRMLIYVSMAIHFIITVVAQVLNYAQCSPPRALWTPVPDAKCWDPKVAADLTIAQSEAYGTWQDLLLAVVPCTIIWSLSLSKSTKLSLCALLSLGLVAGIFSGLKTAHMGNYADRADFTWAVYPIFMWATGENALIVIFGSIPPTKPLFDRWLTGKAIGPSGRSGSYKMHSKGIGDESHTTTFGSSGRRKPRSQMWTSIMDTAVDENDTDGRGTALDDTAILVETSYDVSSQRGIIAEREPDRLNRRI